MQQNDAELLGQDGRVVVELLLAAEEPHLRCCQAPPRGHSKAQVSGSNALRRVELRVLCLLYTSPSPRDS